jgi:hypothetical protein
LEQDINVSVIAKATIIARGSVRGKEKRRRRDPAKRGKPYDIFLRSPKPFLSC